MEKGRKRDRNVNFTFEETERLVSLVEERKNIIERKKSDATTWQEKDLAWNAIERSFNRADGCVFRDAKHLKLKYEALKRDVRKKVAAIRAQIHNTDNGAANVPSLTPIEEKVKDMIFLFVEGGENVDDSNQILPNFPEIISSRRTLGSKVSVILPKKDNVENGEGIPSEVSSEESFEGNRNILNEFQNTSTSHNCVHEEPFSNNVCERKQEEQLNQTKTTPPSTSNLKIYGQNPFSRRKWKSKNHGSLATKKRGALCKINKKWRFQKLAEIKTKIALLQKNMVQEELKFKREMHKLEKEHLSLRIDLLKIKLQNAKEKNM